jgi:hypothetical protein
MVQEDQPVSTTISTSPARSVGRDLQARHVEAGAIVLIEGHMVGTIPVGQGREVVAIITRNWPADGGRVREVRWAGACPGHDGAAPAEGVSIYEAGSAITVLAHAGGAA